MPHQILELDPQYDGFCLNEDFNDLKVEVFKTDSPDGGYTLEANISTPKTLLFSCGQVSRDAEKECDKLVDLFQNMHVYPTFATGKPIPEETVRGSYTNKCKLWKSNYPYSLFVIEDQKDNSFVGRIVMDDCDPHPITELPLPGHAEVGIAITGAKQRQGFGSEAITAITYGWAPYVADEGYKVDGNPLTNLWATAHPDNSSSKIFSAAGYKVVSTFDHPKYKKPRNEYVIDVKTATEIRNRSKIKFNI
jgi:hypothetical protein